MYSHWQEHLFPYHHCEELELLYKASQSYDWNRIGKELAPKFKKAAEEFHRNNKQPSSCPKKKESADDPAHSLTLFELIDFQSLALTRNLSTRRALVERDNLSSPI